MQGKLRAASDPPAPHRVFVGELRRARYTRRASVTSTLPSRTMVTIEAPKRFAHGVQRPSGTTCAVLGVEGQEVSMSRTSRIPGFYKLSIEERRHKLICMLGLDGEASQQLRSGLLDEIV